MKTQLAVDPSRSANTSSLCPASEPSVYRLLGPLDAATALKMTRGLAGSRRGDVLQ
jgi:hypothetical protein